MGAFSFLSSDTVRRESLRYIAPERFLVMDDDIPWSMRISSPSKESDVYSLTMTSFEVRASVVNHPMI